MSLDKAIKSGKEHRQQYRGAKAVDPWCKNHGRCVYCRLGRLHKRRVEDLSMKDRGEE